MYRNIAAVTLSIALFLGDGTCHEIGAGGDVNQ
jgi:hypothetical protein